MIETIKKEGVDTGLVDLIESPDLRRLRCRNAMTNKERVVVITLMAIVAVAFLVTKIHYA